VLSAAVPALGQQRGRPWRVGVLSARRRPGSLDADYYGAFPRRLNELGYVEGRNLLIDWRFADGEYQRLSELAAELVKAEADVILALGPPGTLAAQRATATIPIVFVVSADPVASGIVTSLARPGGNTTGLSNLGVDLIPKHLEMLLAIAPAVSRVALLVNPGNSAHREMLKEVEAANRASRIELLPVNAQAPADIPNAFASMERQKVGAVIVALDPFFIQEARQLATEAARRRLPSVFAFREAAELGGLMSYGQNQVHIYRRAAEYVDRILKGARPGDLPVEQPAMLELVINSRTAKALGLGIPAALRMRAEKVIE
jgi:putative ABC transport system substrate-binding protein